MGLQLCTPNKLPGERGGRCRPEDCAVSNQGPCQAAACVHVHACKNTSCHILQMSAYFKFLCVGYTLRKKSTHTHAHPDDLGCDMDKELNNAEKETQNGLKRNPEWLMSHCLGLATHSAPQPSSPPPYPLSIRPTPFPPGAGGMGEQHTPASLPFSGNACGPWVGRQRHLHYCLAPRKGKGRISLGGVPRSGITASKGVHSSRQLIIAVLLSGRAPDTPSFAHVA